MDKEKAEIYKMLGTMLGKLISNFIADICRLLIVIVVCVGWLGVLYILYFNPTWPTGITATAAPALMLIVVKYLFPPKKDR